MGGYGWKWGYNACRGCSGSSTPFEGVGNFWVSATPPEGVRRWDRMGQEMVSPSEGGTSTAGGQRRAVAGWAQE